MNKREFIKLLKDYQTYNNLLDEACNVFPSIFESKLFGFATEWFEEIIRAYFIEEGIDWVYWWLFERNGNSEMKAYDNDVEIPMNTVEDLWNYVEKYLK